jgi:NAD(P)-dependent dehydrogenase (short-subunit alcohol dehydrogenase family)
MSQQASKTIVITGSTSGIGRGIALRLAREGFNIVLNYVANEEKAQETLHLCRALTTQVVLIKADVSNKADVIRLMHTAIETFGTLDGLINNAAQVHDKPILDMSEDEWDHVIDVNMKGTFLCSQAASRYMIQQENGGVILNIGAPTGIKGRLNGINTCASKAGVMMITQCLALELGPKVRVNSVIPGLTHTEETGERYHLNDPAVLRARSESIPLQRITTPEDIASAVLFLLGDGASFINGSKLVVDGGQYMW